MEVLKVRKSKYTEKLPVTLTTAQRDALKKAAKDRDISCARLVRAAIYKFLSEDVKHVPQ
jgi:hypothetical protein